MNNRLILIFFLVVNIIAALILSSYGLLNVCITSGAVIATYFLIRSVWKKELKDAFRYSLTILFGFCGFIEFILGCVCSPELSDNGCLIAVLVMLIFELALLLYCSYISRTIK